MHEVVVAKYAILSLPQVLVNGAVAGLGFAVPPHRISRLAQQMRHVFEIALVTIEQAVEAYRRKMVRSAGERSEAIAGIKPRFAHGAVADIEILAQPVASRPRVHAYHARVHI